MYFKNYSIVNIYGYPVGKEYSAETRRKLYTKNLQKFINPNETTIIMGDFNAVTEKGEPGLCSYIWQLKNLIEKLNIIDCHHICNKGKRNHLHFHERKRQI